MKFINKGDLTENFTSLPNEVANNPNLSFKAKGILWYLLSKPEDWKTYIKEIVKNGKEGLDAVRTGVNELIKLGYIVRTQERERGIIRDWVYYVYATPGNVVKPTLSPELGYPEVDKPEVDNPTILNTDSTKIDSTKHICNLKEYKNFLQGFNSIVSSSYKGSDKVYKQFQARLKEGYTLKDIAIAIRNASGDEYLMGKNEGNKRYLTPEYILRSNKLDQWLNATPTKKTGMQLTS